jgi:hypothetical protein
MEFSSAISANHRVKIKKPIARLLGGPRASPQTNFFSQTSLIRPEINLPAAAANVATYNRRMILFIVHH